MPEPAEAGDDLVGDQQDVVPAQDLLDRLEVAVRRHDHAARALDRLGDERRDRLGPFGEDQLLELVREPAGANAASSSPGSASQSRCGAVVWRIIGSGRSKFACTPGSPVRPADMTVTPWYPRWREMIFFFSGRPRTLL